MKFESLAARYRTWETEALVRAVTLDAFKYTAEALGLLRAELESRNVPPDQLRAISATQPDEVAESVRSYAGVKGWLALMVFLIAAVSCGLIFQAGMILLGTSASLHGLSVGALGAFGLLTCWHLLRRAPRAPRYAMAWHVAYAILTVAYSVFHYPWDALWEDGEVVGRLIWFGLWCAYLATSKRVKATYSPGESTAEIVSIFS